MKRLLSLCLVLFASTVFAQEESPTYEMEKEQLKKWRKVYQQQAEKHKMFIGDQQKPLVLHPKPLMTYASMFQRQQDNGQFHVWVDEGRPAVVGVMWSELTSDLAKRKLNHSLHSLVDKPIRDELNGSLFWSPSGGVVASKPLLDAPVPAKSKALRLVQMRKLAEEFKVSENHRNKRTRVFEIRQLKVQRQPFMRYESKVYNVIDGAIFAFFLDWDPDLFLLIEARETQRGPRWHYTTGPFTTYVMYVERRGEKWEHRARWAGPKTDPYLTRHAIELRDPIIP